MCALVMCPLVMCPLMMWPATRRRRSSPRWQAARGLRKSGPSSSGESEIQWIPVVDCGCGSRSVELGGQRFIAVVGQGTM